MKATGDTWSQHVLSSNGLAKYIIATSSSTNAAKGSTLNFADGEEEEEREDGHHGEK